MRRSFWLNALLLFTALTSTSLTACRVEDRATLRLATTTSTYDSGLLDVILPEFEALHGVKVEVIAVGTGQALALGERGDVDVLMVHDPSREEAFVASGYGIHRTILMYNDFIIVGPESDPANIYALSTAVEAFKRIADLRAEFASRGDMSGTHAREQLLWEEAGLQPTKDLEWYLSLGQGMGSTLQFANERRAYTLTDRGTFLAQKDNLPNLDLMVGGDSFFENQDERLLNCYSVIIVNPQLHADVEYELASEFLRWITSPATKKQIGELGVEKFNQPLFYPTLQDAEKPVPGQS